MTREDFENGLIAKLKGIKAFYKQYNPQAFEEGNNVYLSMFINGDFISANNRYFVQNENNPDCTLVVNCSKRGDNPIQHVGEELV